LQSGHIVERYETIGETIRETKRLVFKLTRSPKTYLQILVSFIHRTCSNLSRRSVARERSADGEAEQAWQVGEGLKQMAQHCKNGIVVPGRIVPPVKGRRLKLSNFRLVCSSTQ
jgi:hypothetical protein